MLFFSSFFFVVIQEIFIARIKWDIVDFLLFFFHVTSLERQMPARIYWTWRRINKSWNQRNHSLEFDIKNVNTLDWIAGNRIPLQHKFLVAIRSDEKLQSQTGNLRHCWRKINAGNFFFSFFKEVQSIVCDIYLIRVIRKILRSLFKLSLWGTINFGNIFHWVLAQGFNFW